MSLNIGILESSRSAAAPPPVGTLLLDLYPSASVAFSFRKLRTAYSGFCIRVASSASGNPFADIGFVGDVLDTAALLAFIGSNTGRIITWYDQSGNGNNATQSTFANACIIVNAGSLVTDGSKVAINGNQFYLLNSAIIANISYAAFSVMSRTTPTTILASFTGSIVPYTSFALSNSQLYNANNVSEIRRSFANTGRFLFGTFNISNVLSAYLNGTIMINDAVTTQILAGNFDRIMGRNSSQSLQGKAQEFVLYNTNQSANNSAINTNINSYYSIY